MINMNKISLIILAICILFGCNKGKVSETKAKSAIAENISSKDSTKIAQKFQSWPYSYVRHKMLNYVLTENLLYIIDDSGKWSSIDLKSLIKEVGYLSDFLIIQHNSDKRFVFSTTNQIIITDEKLKIISKLEGGYLFKVSENWLVTQGDYILKGQESESKLKWYDLKDLSYIQLPDSNCATFYVDKDSLYMINQYCNLTTCSADGSCSSKILFATDAPKGISFILGFSDKNNFLLLNAIEYNQYNILTCTKQGQILDSVVIDLSNEELDMDFFNSSNTSLDAMERLFFYSPEERTVRVVLPLKNRTYKNLSYSIPG